MESDSPIGGVFIATAAGFVIALLGSWCLLLWYRASVLRLMRKKDTLDPSRASGVWPSASRREPSLEGGFGRLVERLRQRERTAAFTYLAASLVAGLIATLILAPAAFGAGLLPARAIALMTVTYAWPLVLVLATVATLTKRQTLLVATLHVGTLLLVAAWIAVAPARPASPAPSNAWQSVPVVLQALAFWGGSQLIPTIATVLVLNRWVKAVGPLVLVFSLLGVTILHAALRYTVDDNGFTNLLVLVWDTIATGGWPYPDVAPRQILPGILAGLGIALVAGLPIGWLVNRWMARRYRRKQESDQTLFADAVWAVFVLAAAQSLFLGGGWWALSGVVIFAAHKATTLAGFRLTAPRGSHHGPQLLWLRRFKGGRRSQRLYAMLNARWRWIGPVHLIGGPDLARQTVEPYRFLDFLAGQLEGHFISTDTGLDARVATIDTAPDRDGRFRVNEFFCSDRLWQPAVRALIHRSDLTVMDLRGLGQEADTGVHDELAILAAEKGFDDLVIFCTDPEREKVRAALREAAASLSTTLPEPPMVDPTGRERSIILELFETMTAARAPSTAALLAGS